MEEFILDELDYKILNLIANDTRVSFLEVSRLCNVSGAAIHQRVQKMINNNIITGSEFKLNLEKIGYKTCAYINLHFSENADLEKIQQQLEQIPEIVECHMTMGDYEMFIKLHTFSNTHLYDLVNDKIKPMGLIRMQTIFSYKQLFSRQITFNQ